jgi:hypothetical protein
VQRGKFLDHGQTYAQPGRFQVRAAACEKVEDVRKNVVRNANAVVCNPDDHITGFNGHSDVQMPARGGVLAGIAQQVQEHLLQACRVCSKDDGRRGQRQAQLLLIALHDIPEFVDHRLERILND